MVGFGDGGDSAFATTAAGALLDGNGGWDAGNEVDIRPGHLLHELARVSVHRVEEAALALGEQEVKGQGALTGTANASDHDEPVAGDDERDVLEVVLTRAMNTDGISV